MIKHTEFIHGDLTNLSQPQGYVQIPTSDTQGLLVEMQPHSQGFSLESGRGGPREKTLPPSREKPWERGWSR